MTAIEMTTDSLGRKLQYRFFSLGKTTCTKIMGGIAIVFRWIKAIHENARGKLYKAILFKVMLALFDVHEFLFEGAVFCLERQYCILKIDNHSSEVNRRIKELGGLIGKFGATVSRRQFFNVFSKIYD